VLKTQIQNYLASRVAAEAKTAVTQKAKEELSKRLPALKNIFK